MSQKVSVYLRQRMLNVKEFLSLPLRLDIPGLNWGPAETRQGFNVYFDPRRTTINRATLQWSASPTCHWMALHVSLDGALLVDEAWGWGTESRGGSVDITAAIKGAPTHSLDLTVYKHPVDYAFPCGMSVGLKVIIDWTGDEPSVTAPVAADVWTYVKWAFLIAGLGVGGLVLVKGIEAYKKR